METTTIEKKNHLYEIDFLRAITVFSVVTIHSLSATIFLFSKSVQKTRITDFLIHALHYNREMFMFVSGLVLTYAYFNKRFSAKQFWLKRILFIFLPYLAWTLFYIVINNHSLSAINFLKLFFMDVLTGNASYQLYYILLTLQFYAIFPIFLWLIKKVREHAILVSSLSLLIQLVLMYLDFQYVQTGKLKTAIVTNFLIPYQDRLVFSYQFFFIFGSFVAIYFTRVYSFIQKYGRLTPYIFIIALASYAYFFNFQIYREHENINHALSVLQPSVVLYSILVIALFSWMATLWVKKKSLFSLVKKISETSFGIFFVHVLILNFIVSNIIPRIPHVIPTPLEITFVVLATFTSSVIFCLLLLRTKYLSWLIGKAGSSK